LWYCTRLSLTGRRKGGAGGQTKKRGIPGMSGQKRKTSSFKSFCKVVTLNLIMMVFSWSRRLHRRKEKRSRDGEDQVELVKTEKGEED